MENLLSPHQLQLETPIKQALRGKDLSRYRVVPSSELKERIISDKDESAKTNLLSGKQDIERSSFTNLSWNTLATRC